MTWNRTSRWTRMTAAVSAAMLASSGVAYTVPVAARGDAEASSAARAPAATQIPSDQLDSLVAPIALYPDELLAQVFAASTYPLEIVQLQQWLAKNPDLKGDALASAVEKQPWDPAVQGLAGIPDVVKRLGDDIQWTTELGNAFLAQEKDVMDAVQRMRKKASDNGNLKTTEQQKVTTQVVESKQVIVIQQANPQVVYVPVYTPTVVYGPPIYPYPPIYYPPPGYYAAGVAIGFGVGIAMSACCYGGWGYGPRWGYSSVHINVNNRYVNHYNRYNTVNRYGGANGNWNHNPAHRGGTPYADRTTANRYGGTARGDSSAARQGAANRPTQGTTARQTPAGTNRTGSTTGANRTGSAAGASRPATTGATRSGSTGASDRVGSRSVPSNSAPGRSNNAFGGASSSRPSNSAARSSSSRGSSSVGASRARSGGGRGRR